MNEVRILIQVLISSFLLQSAVTVHEVANLRLKKILDNDYDKRKPRSDSAGGKNAVVVSIRLHIQEIALSEDALSMRIWGDVVQSWVDDRLAPVTQDTKDLRLGAEWSELLWKPVVSVWNSRFEETVFDAKQRTVVLTKNGRIITEQRLQLEVACTNFTSHLRPLGCVVQLQNRHNTNDEVVLDLEKISPDPLTSNTGYILTKMETGDCTKATATGTYSCKQLSMTFQANINFFVTEIYGVSFLLVILSWIGFWLDGFKGQTFIRLGLGLMVLLILVVHGIGYRVLHNKAGIPGSVEVWIAFCILFVLATLVEFAFVHVLIRLIPAKLRQIFCRRDCSQVQDDHGPFMRAAQVIDVTCGLLFPLIFVLFNVVYWGTV